MGEPDVVPEILSNPLNLYVIIAILVAGAAIFTSMQFLSEDDVGIFAFSLSVVFAGGAAVVAFFVSKQYQTGVLAKAYLFLGLGFTSYVTAELLYYSFELVFNIEPYPSIADVFFFALYPLVLGHLLLNIRFFNSGFSKTQKLWIPAIPVFAIVVYVTMSLGVPDAEANFDFYYGLIFVSGASVTLSFTIVGALTFRQGTLGTVWLLLVIGLMINAAGDVWYYHLEIFGEYSDAHPVTTVWFVANMFVIYALCKHIKTI
ncbi:histidine kinase [Nitrosopumilus sp. K4]|uniref:histidine kinase n=1 Tax=Nitrosopumilus sp. K4 TaxID=2795383 RepID=UPI001BA6A780|nr:histidine kinase [Nitrosopumilus sp. K4]QUC64093.1 histidine kinase [Nitrosopumilus sp. K4]